MKAVILAAGEGRRMRPLTFKTPKPLLKIDGRSIIDYTLSNMPPEIDELIVVTKHLGGQIKDFIGRQNRHMKVKYAQGSDKGTAYSFMAAKNYLKNERFLVITGDDIPSTQDIKNCLAKDLSILVFKPRDPRVCGMAYQRKNGSIWKIIEKPNTSKASLAITGVMVLNTNIFNYEPILERGEYYLSSMVGLFSKDHKIFPVMATNFIGEITTPQDLIRVGNILMARHKT